MASLPRGQTLPAGDVHMIKSSPFPKIMTKSDPNSIKIPLFSAAWGQALPPGKDIFLPVTLLAFLGIRPDPDILAGPLRGLPSKSGILRLNLLRSLHPSPNTPTS